MYTHAEIIGDGYPEQWSKAQAFASHLAALQEKLLSTLPSLHHSLPADKTQLQHVEDLAKDHVMGLHRLSVLVKRIQPRLFFNVIYQLTWSDLMRIIERSGLCDNSLLQAAIIGSHPTCVSVGELRVDEDKIY